MNNNQAENKELETIDVDVKDDLVVEDLGLKKELEINKRLFRKTPSGKYKTQCSKFVSKNQLVYGQLAKDMLTMAFPEHEWDFIYDSKLKVFYIFNSLSANYIPEVKLSKIKSYLDFSKIILAYGKDIIVKCELDNLDEEKIKEKIKYRDEFIDNFIKKELNKE